jgi:enoyl-[acyl-carrier protein] reductase II
MIGQISGMLDDIKPVKEIIEDIVNGLPQAVAELQKNYL